MIQQQSMLMSTAVSIYIANYWLKTFLQPANVGLRQKKHTVKMDVIANEMGVVYKSGCACKYGCV